MTINPTNKTYHNEKNPKVGDLFSSLIRVQIETKGWAWQIYEKEKITLVHPSMPKPQCRDWDQLITSWFTHLGENCFQHLCLGRA